MQSSDDRKRFADVVMPHIAEAHNLARWLTGREADADDVVQEACLRAYKGIAGFSGGNARAWVFTIVRNTAYSWLRRNRPPGLVDGIDVDSMEADVPAHSPEAALIAKAQAAELERALEALAPEFREVIVLRELHGLDYRAIAEVTGVPLGTVMSRLSRARRRLMAALAEDGV